jgi:ATPase family AAA domain-containing protein 3A/B
MFRPSSNPSKDTGKPGKVSGSDTFSGTVDPTGLERAAKAAREIDASPNAKSALDVVRQQELTKQSENEAKSAELRAYEAQQRSKNIELQGEEQRKTLEKQAEYARGQELYRDKLDRERQKDMLGMQLQAQKHLKDEERAKDEESVLRQEAIRRKTLEYEAALRTQADAAKARAEAEGRIEEQRRNHDLAMQERRLELRENRKTTLEAIRVATSSVGGGISAFLSDERKVFTAVGGITAAAGGIYVARASSSVLGAYIAARLGKPSLVRDTSRVTLATLAREPISSVQKVISRSRADADNALSGVVLQDSTENRLRRIARATRNARRHGAPFRNVLLTGPPGTGKTLFAKGLARESGLEYAIFTGGDLAPLGAAAVTELHKLFDWASTTRRGLLLFIDEADAFLRTRSSATGATEEMRNALNAFLYRTGEPSTRFMVMMATNRPHEFDEAAADRVDDIVPFNLPGTEQRRQMLQLYVQKYLKAARVPIKLPAKEFWDKFCEEAVEATDGFSGRETTKMVIGWQAAGYATSTATLSVEEARQVLSDHVRQKVLKHEWAASQQSEPTTRAGIAQAAAFNASGSSSTRDDDAQGIYHRRTHVAGS